MCQWFFHFCRRCWINSVPHPPSKFTFYAPIAGRSVGRDAVIQFLRGARIINPPRPRTVPPCDLPTVLRALKGPPFEPLQSSPRLSGQNPLWLSSNLLGSHDQHCSSPSFALSVHIYMDPRYHLLDDTQATDDPQGSPCAWCILLTPLGLIPRESWFRVVPRHSTAWLDWFPYKRRYSTQYEWNIERERTRLLS